MAKEIPLDEASYEKEYWKYQADMRKRALKEFGKLCLLVFSVNEYATETTLPDLTNESVVFRSQEDIIRNRERLEYFFSAAMLAEIEKLVQQGNIIECSTAVAKCISAYERWLSIPNTFVGIH